MSREHIVHPIALVYDKHSKVLILGSFPSVKSREYGFFYGHKQNRFWRLLAELCGERIPNSVEEKKALLLRHGIALWDVIGECDIEGSADSSIQHAVPNDLSRILKTAPIAAIFVNGKTAGRLYVKHLEKVTGIEAVCLPSTSPANAAWTYEKLLSAWRGELKNYLS